MVLKMDFEEYTSSKRITRTTQLADSAKAVAKTPLQLAILEEHKMKQMGPLSPMAQLANEKVSYPFYKLLRLSRPAPNQTTPTYHVSLKVGKEQFVGEGRSEKEARTAAAVEALNHFSTTSRRQQQQLQLQHPGSVRGQPELYVPESRRESIEAGIDTNPVTLVLQLARSRDQWVNFVTTRLPGKGPFLTKCVVGGVTTEGEGTGEKESKKMAARKMLEVMKKLIYVPHQANKEKEIERNKKSIKVRTLSDMSIDGSGPDRSTSTNNAAESMLKRMDVSRTLPSHAQSPETSENMEGLDAYRNQGSEKEKMNDEGDATTAKADSRAESSMDIEVLRENFSEKSEDDCAARRNIPLVNVSGTQMDAVDFVSRFVQVVQMAADLKGPNGVSSELKDAKSASRTQRQTEQQSFSRRDARDYREAAVGGDGSVLNGMDAVGINAQDKKSDQRVSALPAEITKEALVKKDRQDSGGDVVDLDFQRAEDSAEFRTFRDRPSIDGQDDKLLEKAVDDEMGKRNLDELDAETADDLKLKRKADDDDLSGQFFFLEVGERPPKQAKEDSGVTDEEATNGGGNVGGLQTTRIENDSAESMTVREKLSVDWQGDKPSGESVEKASDRETNRMSFVELDAGGTIDDLKQKRKADGDLPDEIFFSEMGERPAKQTKEDHEGRGEDVRAEEEYNTAEDVMNGGENVGKRLTERMEEDSAESRAIRDRPNICKSSIGFEELENQVDIEAKKKMNSGQLDEKSAEDTKLKRDAYGDRSEGNVFFRAFSSSHSTEGKEKTKERSQKGEIAQRDQGRRELGFEKKSGNPVSEEVDQMQEGVSDQDQETDVN